MWRQVNPISKNFVTLGLRNISWKKSSLVGSQWASHCEMIRKWECQNLLNYHMAIPWSRIGYHTSCEWGDSGLPADQKNFEFAFSNSYFQAYFWVALGSTKLHPHFGLSLSHFFQISGYHTPTWRGYPGLWYDPIFLKISCQIRELELDYVSIWDSPRTGMCQMFYPISLIYSVVQNILANLPHLRGCAKHFSQYPSSKRLYQTF